MTQLALRRNEHIDGNAMIELALVLPLLCLLVFVGIDIIRALNTYQTALTLSRNIATTAYRQCVIDFNLLRGSNYLNPVTSPGNFTYFSTSNCLASVRDQFRATVSLISPNADFVVSMYHMDSQNQENAASSASAAASSAAAAGMPTPEPVPTPLLVPTFDAAVAFKDGDDLSSVEALAASRYSLANDFQQPSASGDISGNTTKALEDFEVLVVAEVFVPYNAYFKGIMNLLNFSGDKIYAATLY